MPETPRPGDLYVSPDGDDTWSGTHPEPTDGGDDGPFRTVERAQLELRDRRTAAADRPRTVWLRGGRYHRDGPVRFGPDDVGATYASYPGEEPVLVGGEPVTEWEETEVDGTRAWVADLPAVARGEWAFDELYVDGERRPRPRLPEEGYYRIRDVPGLAPNDGTEAGRGDTAFHADPDDLEAWADEPHAEVVALHYWVEERLGPATADPDTGRVETARGALYSLTEQVEGRYARYYVENVFGALSPGEWYLDRDGGRLYYCPREGECREETTVVAPRTSRLLRFDGDPDAPVSGVRVEGVTLTETDATYPDDPPTADGVPLAGDSQARHVPGVVRFEWARDCALEECTVAEAGWYGVEVGEGCRGLRVVGNDLSGLGAGGVKITGADARAPRERRTGHLRITDNHVRDIGRVYHGAGGISASNVFDSDLSFNHVHDFYYNGISCNGITGYYESASHDNRIEYNHVHDVGQGLLSDMGGIYTIGVQPGTTVRGNHVHDVETRDFGGWGIYLDNGTANVVVERNVCHDTTAQAFNQNYGRENRVVDNVFAFGGDGAVSLLRADGHEWVQDGRLANSALDREMEDLWPRVALSRDKGGVSFTLQRNLLVADGDPLLVGYLRGYGGDVRDRDVDSDRNLFVDVSGEAHAADGVYEDGEWTVERTYSLAELREWGYDPNSVVADPGVADIEARDFALGDDSPARALGIDPVDPDDTGPRPPDERA